MDFYGLDILGAIAPSARKQKAAASGQRAIAAGQRLAKRAPRLAAAIVAAGQKALKASGAVSTAKLATTAPQKTAQPSPSTSPTQQASRPPAKAPVARQTAPVRPGAPPRRTTRMGEDVPTDEGTDQQADIYSQLADAAAKVADFMAYFQGLVDQLPQNLPIVQNGLGVISQLQNWFAGPLEAALQGDQAALAKTPDINDVVQNLIDQQNNQDKRWPWDWAALAETYLKIHPPAAPPDAGTAQPADGSAPAQPGTTPSGSIAKVIVSPSSIIVPVGGSQAFKANTLDAKNKVIVSQSPVTWSASGGATVDPSGNFTGQAAGNYTITATVDGVSGTASAIVQSASAAPSPGGYGGGGGGGGYGGSGGGGYDGGQGGGYADEQPQDEGEQPMYAESDQGAGDEQYPREGGGSDEELDGAIDELGALMELGKGGGGGHGGHHGGHHHHGGGRRFEGGGPWYYGPWWPTSGIEIDEPFDEPTVDEFAEAVADKLAKKRVHHHVAVGLDSVGLDLDLRTPSDYRNAVAQLKTSADNLNLTAGLQPAWKGIYENANRLYEQYKDAGWLNFASMSDTTWYAIADAQKRVDEFAAQMRAKGEPVYEPVHTPPTQSGLTGGAFDWVKDNWKWLVGGGVALVTVPVILPPIIGAAVASRARR